MINHNHRCIFIHVIKTGGVSIASALELSRKQCHWPVAQVVDAVGKSHWNDYLTFAFVRNPWDKMVSQYHYNHGSHMPEGTSFDEYIRHWGRGGRVSKNPCEHAPYFADRQGNVMVDFVGRFEHFSEDFTALCTRLEIRPPELPHKNQSDHRHYGEYYDDETRAIVAKRFERDIELFGFDFDSPAQRGFGDQLAAPPARAGLRQRVSRMLHLG